ncbi:MAG: molybdopterin-dependent oxidoreductase [Actinobacteria bacterium]|nr:molybdopterin-dependent oxidoreductase [Actinomycetota bacterium]
MRSLTAGGVSGNRRLTAGTGTVMHTLLWVQIASAGFFALETFNVVLPSGPWHTVIRPVHFFVGFLLAPLIVIKIGSTNYKFVRYYLRDRRYRAAGAPGLFARALAPVLMGSVIVLFVSGWEMWSFTNAWEIAWIPVHVISAMVFTIALVAHVALHVREAHREAARDMAGAPPDDPAGSGSEWHRGLIARRTLLAGGLGAGLALAVSTSQWPFARLAWLSPRQAGDGALDFPVMNYEGSMQHVDVERWRLRVDSDQGLVSRPLLLDYDELMRIATEEHEYPIDCVTGWTATRRWTGVPLSRLLAMAGASPDFGHIQVRSTSGYHWDHHRDNVLLAGSLLVTHVNGVPLDDNHGYPARILIPGTVGQSNIKWVDGITIRRGAPEIYVAPNLTFNSSLPVSGKLLPKNPAGQRR